MLKADESESNNCDCDVLQINDPYGVIGNQNFTRQNGTYNEKPYYVSSQWNVISWYRHRWSYYTYNPKFIIIEPNETDITNLFSFEDMCKGVTIDIFWNRRIVKSQCLISQTRNCSANKELTRINEGSRAPGIHEKLQANNLCKFPFIYKNVTYKSCTKKDYDKFWCATTVNAKNHLTSYSYCDDLCPQEDNKSKVVTNGNYLSKFILSENSMLLVRSPIFSEFLKVWIF